MKYERDESQWAEFNYSIPETSTFNDYEVLLRSFYNKQKSRDFLPWFW